MIPGYLWRPSAEVKWSVAMAVLAYLIQVLSDPDFFVPENWTDARKVLVAAFVGCLRAALGAIAAQMAPTGRVLPVTEPEPPAVPPELMVPPTAPPTVVPTPTADRPYDSPEA